MPLTAHYTPQVILHTDHCAKKLLPWMDGMLSASERYYETHGEPLFSSRRSPCKSRAAPNHTRTARRRQRPTQPRVASLSKGSGRASSTHTREERSLGRSAAPEGRHQARLSVPTAGDFPLC